MFPKQPAVMVLPAFKGLQSEGSLRNSQKNPLEKVICAHLQSRVATITINLFFLPLLPTSGSPYIACSKVGGGEVGVRKEVVAMLAPSADFWTQNRSKSWKGSRSLFISLD